MGYSESEIDPVMDVIASREHPYSGKAGDLKLKLLRLFEQ